MCRPSRSKPGKGAGSDPVAIRMRSASSTCPSCPATSTRPGAVMRAVPVTWLTPFFLKRLATPCVSPRTTLSLRAIIAGRSSVTSATRMPCTAMWRRVFQKSSLESSRAFDGMQPMRRQVPPRADAFSTQATRMPSWAARIAAT